MANIAQIAVIQDVCGILEVVPTAEVATIADTGTRELTEIEKMAYVVQKNKVFNPTTLQMSWKG